MEWSSKTKLNTPNQNFWNNINDMVPLSQNYLQ
jgi:hypothetical protein